MAFIFSVLEAVINCSIRSSAFASSQDSSPPKTEKLKLKLNFTLYLKLSFKLYLKLFFKLKLKLRIQEMSNPSKEFQRDIDENYREILAKFSNPTPASGNNNPDVPHTSTPPQDRNRTWSSWSIEHGYIKSNRIEIDWSKSNLTESKQNKLIDRTLIYRTLIYRIELNQIEFRRPLLHQVTTMLSQQ